MIGNSESEECRGCGKGPENGSHVTIGCMNGEARGRRWSLWSQMDDRKRWWRVVKDSNSEQRVVDVMEQWFA